MGILSDITKGIKPGYTGGPLSGSIKAGMSPIEAVKAAAGQVTQTTQTTPGGIYYGPTDQAGVQPSAPSTRGGMTDPSRTTTPDLSGEAIRSPDYVAPSEVTTMPTGEVTQLDVPDVTPQALPTTPVITAPSVAAPTGYADPTQVSPLASEQITSLLAADSPYLEQARTKGEQYAATRGMLSSSIGAGAAEGAAIEAALPIAAQDAAFAANLETMRQQAGIDITQQVLAGNIDLNKLSFAGQIDLANMITKGDIDIKTLREGGNIDLIKLAEQGKINLQNLIKSAELDAATRTELQNAQLMTTIGLSDASSETKNAMMDYLNGVDPGTSAELFGADKELSTATPEDYKETRDQFETFTNFIVDSEGRDNWKTDEKSPSYIPMAEFMQYDTTLFHTNEYYYHDAQLKSLMDTFGSVDNAIAAAKLWAGPNVTDTEIRALLASTYE